MKLDEIKNIVLEVREEKGDNELAHTLEDELHVAFIKHVAESADKELSRMAKEVLKTSKIRFARWRS